MSRPRDSVDTEFRWFVVYQQDIMQARLSFDAAISHRGHLVQYALLRDAIVAYARPFSGNRAPGGHKHSLSARKWVWKEHRALHAELVGIRNGLVAHSDFAVRNPRVKSHGGSAKFVSLQHMDVPSLIARQSAIRSLFEQVDGALNGVIGALAPLVSDDV